jgi:ketose-bisphosphate aldolase
MALVSSAAIMSNAARSKCVVVAFNVFNNESIDAVIKAAEDAQVPVIIAVNEPDLFHFGIDEVAAIVRIKAERARTEVVLHLDHGMSVGVIARCIKAGFTSVMMDPFQVRDGEKIAVVMRVVEFAHAVGVSVESMVGSLRLALEGEGEGDSVEERTDPLKAGTFSRSTGIDSLAVSVGTEHGSFLTGKRTEIDMQQLKEIARRVDIPLVIHGGSAVRDEQLSELRNYNVGKMNIGSAIRAAYKKTLVSALQDGLMDVRDAAVRARQAMYDVASNKIAMLTL